MIKLTIHNPKIMNTSFINTLTFCWIIYSATFIIRKAAYTCNPDTVSRPAIFNIIPNISFLKYLIISILLQRTEKLQVKWVIFFGHLSEENMYSEIVFILLQFQTNLIRFYFLCKNIHIDIALKNSKK